MSINDHVKRTSFSLILRCITIIESKIKHLSKVIFSYEGEHLIGFPNENSLIIKNKIGFLQSIFGFKNMKRSKRSTKRSTKRSNRPLKI